MKIALSSPRMYTRANCDIQGDFSSLCPDCVKSSGLACFSVLDVISFQADITVSGRQLRAGDVAQW